MKLLLLEYITAGGLSRVSMPGSLLREGLLMRDALFSDFNRLNDIEIVTTYDARLDSSQLTAFNHSCHQAICIDDTFDAMPVWQELIKSCDAALIVAPETNGVLAALMHMVEVAGIKNLGCLSPVVKITSNKYDTYQLLKHANILSIATYTVHDFLQTDDEDQSLVFSHGAVVKPIDGAGCEDTLYFDDVSALRAWLQVASHDQSRRQDQFIIQPYQTGMPASISMLCKNGVAWLLSCNQQTIEIHHHSVKGHPAFIHYKGSQVNALTIHENAFAALAHKIAAVLPGLNGYVGVDVIVNNNDVYVIEINPRITTSYIGLCKSLGVNPAGILLDLAYADPLDFKLPVNMTAKTVEINVSQINIHESDDR